MNKKKSVPFVTHREHYASETYMRMFLYVTESGLKSIIKEKKIRLSCPWRTNDITEGVSQGAVTQDERCRSYGYVCFSAVCDSPSMWGYYAGKGRGACLVFDFPVCQKNQEDNEGKKSYLILRNGMLTADAKVLHKIQYQRDRIPQIVRDFDTRILLTKAIDWQHEKEYRILYRLSDVADSLSYVDSQTNRTEYYDSTLLEYLSGIILGPNCNWNIEEVRTELSHSCKKNLGAFWENFSLELYEQKGEQYAVDFSMCNAMVVRAKLSKRSFLYNVPIADIEARVSPVPSDVLIRLKGSCTWRRLSSLEGRPFSPFFTWLIEEAYQAVDFRRFCGIETCGVVRLRDGESPDDILGVYIVPIQGGIYILPNIRPDVLHHLMEYAKSRVV